MSLPARLLESFKLLLALRLSIWLLRILLIWSALLTDELLFAADGFIGDLRLAFDRDDADLDEALLVLPSIEV